MKQIEIENCVEQRYILFLKVYILSRIHPKRISHELLKHGQKYVEDDLCPGRHSILKQTNITNVSVIWIELTVGCAITVGIDKECLQKVLQNNFNSASQGKSHTNTPSVLFTWLCTMWLLSSFGLKAILNFTYFVGVYRIWMPVKLQFSSFIKDLQKNILFTINKWNVDPRNNFWRFQIKFSTMC